MENKHIHNHHEHDHHDHDHEHEHHHDHDHCSHDHNHEDIESHTHDESIIVSGKREIPGELETVKEKLTKELESLGEWIENQGGIIGHIKAYANGGGKGYMLSNTYGEVQCKETLKSDVHVNIAVIVFKVDIEELECRVAEIFERLTKN